VLVGLFCLLVGLFCVLVGLSCVLVGQADSVCGVRFMACNVLVDCRACGRKQSYLYDDMMTIERDCAAGFERDCW
jgi:hypothetical protein